MAADLRVAGVLTVSDRASSGQTKDTSGPNLANILCSDSAVEQLGISHVITRCVPDERILIQEALKEWADEKRLSLILTTGGTGFSPRDITPEATKELLDKEAPGLVIAMISKSLQITPMAMLSRPVCGIRGHCLIINLPGSKKGSEECLSFLLPCLSHALDLLSGSSEANKTHQKMSEAHSHSSCSHSHHAVNNGSAVGARTKEDFYPVAMRPRHSPYPMLSVDNAIAIILANIAPDQSATSSRLLKDSFNCILAERVIARQPFPPFPASIKDGYAVISSDDSIEREVLAPVIAGQMVSSDPIRLGTCVRITTGAPLPAGADAVVMVENTELISSSDDGSIEKRVKILSTAVPGLDVRSVGSDIAEGETVLEKGILLGPSEIGLAASVGMETLLVVSPPRVGVLSTGNEVIDLGHSLSPGQIYDSNRHMLLAAVKKCGFEGIDLGIAQDTREGLINRISDGLDKADILITSGGVSMGEKDLLKPVLVKDFSATIHFGRVFMKPGKPTTFATLVRQGKTKLIFSLPGNPVSAAVTYQLFVLPALKKLAGHSNPHPLVISAKLTHSVSLDQRPEYQRVEINWSLGTLPSVHSTGNQRSSRLLSLRGANGLMILPPATEEKQLMEATETVQVILL